MNERRYTVLFLCTGNSARSIMAEALLNHWGKGRFQTWSAGSYPKGQVHPLAIEILRCNHLPTENLRSKSWDEFAMPDAPSLDFVFTVCDRAAQEVCPIWPGQPMTAHWGIHDPAAVVGSDDVKERAFNKAFRDLDARIKIFTSLRLEALDQISLRRQLDAIGQVGRETGENECAAAATSVKIESVRGFPEVERVFGRAEKRRGRSSSQQS
jgi:protein-tyrosine-phosphatase